MTRDLSQADYVYLWADGIHLDIRLGEGKLCLLVMIGVRADGRKELIALADGYRESAESWADLLRDCARRGMRAPVLAVGDGALGFWTALREVFPQAATQRCWFHKTANVLGALPKSAHPGAKKALAEIWNAEDKDHARTAVRAFAAAYGAKFPKAAAKITDDEEELLAFYDYPAEHWVHLRTTNPIESTFATVRLRTKVTKGTGPRPPPWRWPSSSSSPPSTAGAWSTHPIWSRSSAPGRPSSTASSSNDPRTRLPRRPSRKPPYLHPPVTASVRFGVSAVMVTLVLGMPESAPCPPDSCRVLRAGGRVTGARSARAAAPQAPLTRPSGSGSCRAAGAGSSLVGAGYGSAGQGRVALSVRGDQPWRPGAGPGAASLT